MIAKHESPPDPHPSGQTEIFRAPGGPLHTFTALPKTIFRMMPQLEKSDVLVAVVLAEHRNENDGRCFPSYETIAAEAGLRRDTVRLALQRLTDAGLVRRTNTQRSNRYEFVVDAEIDRQKKDRAANPTGTVTVSVERGDEIPQARSTDPTGAVNRFPEARSPCLEQDSYNKTKEQSSSRQDDERSSDGSDAVEQMLMDRGVFARQARRLAGRPHVTAERVAAWARHIDASDNIGNPASYLATCLKDDREPPEQDTRPPTDLERMEALAPDIRQRLHEQVTNGDIPNLAGLPASDPMVQRTMARFAKEGGLLG